MYNHSYSYEQFITRGVERGSRGVERGSISNMHNDKIFIES